MEAAVCEPWDLQPGLAYLNHGSFGATPRVLLEQQAALRREMEADPVGFLWRSLPGRIDPARAALAEFLDCDPGGLVFVPNATHAVNAVLGSIDWREGDRIVTTDHGYNACHAAVERVAARHRLDHHVVPLPWPVPPGADLAAPVLDACNERTRLVILDHVTSPTAIRLPVGRIVSELRAKGVDTLIDGAHAPGMIDCRPDEIGATWYTGNLHKWVCAPKGAAFFQTAVDWRERTFPCSTSHGWNTPMDGRSRYQAMFDWTGTVDPSAWLCVPETLRFIASLDPRGWDGVRDRNHRAVVEARRFLMERLNLDAPCDESLLGSMATLRMPGGGVGRSAVEWRNLLRDDFSIEVQTLERDGAVWFRISRQLYNGMEDYERLAGALRRITCPPAR